jgi:phage protein D
MCAEKEEKTKAKLVGITGRTIGGALPSYLMGRVTEPIPYWSRMYGGEWYNLKIEEGCTLSEENMVKVKAAVEKAYEGVEQVAPEVAPGKARKVKAKAKVEAPTEAPPEVKAEKILENLPTVKAPPAPKRRVNAKKQILPQGIVEGEIDISEHEIVRITVEKREVDGRSLYLDPVKDKLYDMKFKYVGRLKEGAIVDHPDSDAD